MDRALFLKRLLASTVCAAVPPDVLRLLDRPDLSVFAGVYVA